MSKSNIKQKTPSNAVSMGVPLNSRTSNNFTNIYSYTKMKSPSFVSSAANNLLLWQTRLIMRGGILNKSINFSFIVIDLTLAKFAKKDTIENIY